MIGKKLAKAPAVIKQSADEALEYAESIINTVREPLIVLDQDLRVVTASRSFYEVFKVKPEETMGQLIYDLGNKQWDIPKLRELLETILPQKTNFDNYEVEHNFATIGRRIMLLNARQIQRVLGKERVILLAVEDITERKEIEAGLEKTRKELAVIKKTADEASEYSASVIDTVREPLIALDQDLRVVSVSRSFYDAFKVKPEETVGQLIYDLGNKQWDIPKLRELLETILPQQATFDNYEVEHNFATIGRRVMLLNARQIQRVLGRERIILLAIEDITERRQIEKALAERNKQLERSNVELQRFASVASHDLQEPLRTIASYMQLLERRYKSQLDGDAKEFIDFAINGANRLQKMISGLLEYSRVETRGDPFEMVNCESVLEHVVSSLTVAIRESKAEITHDPLPTVFADRMQLTSLFQNLIANSIRYRGSEPLHIHISSVKQKEEYIFAVKDNGIGIDPEYKDQIFVIFQRLHGRDVPGIGLGLALSKRIIERLGGRIWLESETGKGAIFYFTIPIKGGD